MVNSQLLLTLLSRARFFPITDHLHPVRAHPSSRGPHYRVPNHKSRLDPQPQAEAEEVKAWLFATKTGAASKTSHVAENMPYVQLQVAYIQEVETKIYSLIHQLNGAATQKCYRKWAPYINLKSLTGQLFRKL